MNWFPRLARTQSAAVGLREQVNRLERLLDNERLDHAVTATALNDHKARLVQMEAEFAVFLDHIEQRLRGSVPAAATEPDSINAVVERHDCGHLIDSHDDFGCAAVGCRCQAARLRLMLTRSSVGAR